MIGHLYMAVKNTTMMTPLGLGTHTINPWRPVAMFFLLFFLLYGTGRNWKGERTIPAVLLQLFWSFSTLWVGTWALNLVACARYYMWCLCFYLYFVKASLSSGLWCCKGFWSFKHESLLALPLCYLCTVCLLEPFSPPPSLPTPS